MGAGAILMWATMPKILHQPYLAMLPDDPAGATIYGEQGNEPVPPGWGLKLQGYPSTWRAAGGVTNLQAVHVVIESRNEGNLIGTPLRVWLGDRYSVRLDRVAHTGFNGDTFIAGVVSGLGGNSTEYLRLSVLDDETPLVELVLRGSQWIQEPFANPQPDYQLACGYFAADAGIFLYANAGVLRNRFSDASNVPVKPQGGFNIPSIPCFGAGTVQTKVAVDSSDIYGEMRIEGPFVRIPVMAAHYDLFLSHAEYNPDSIADKRQRQGTTIGSLRSFANNFDQPMPPGLRVVGNELPAPKPQTIARVDCAGHYDIFTHTDAPQPSTAGLFLITREKPRYVAAVAGRIESDTAYVKNEVAAASNISSVHSENVLLSKLRVVMTAGKTNFVYTLPEVVWEEVTSLEANNEYIAYKNTPITGTGFISAQPVTRVFPRQNVLVEISRYEIIGNHMAATLDDVSLSVQYSVHIVAFIREPEEGQTAASNAVKRFLGFRLLNDNDVTTLFSGGVVQINGTTNANTLTAVSASAFTIQAIGTA